MRVTKSSQIVCRLDKETHSALANVGEAVGVAPADLLRGAATAIVRAYEASAYLTLPLTLADPLSIKDK